MRAARRVARHPAATVAAVAATVALTGCTPAASAPASPGTTAARSTTAAPSATPSSTSAPTSTTSAPASPVDVVGLGDSVMSGTACGCEPFISRYAAALGARAHTTSHVANLGQPGLTVPGLTTQVATGPAQKALGTASVVVVTIGANDLVPLVSQWQAGSCGSACVKDATARLTSPLSTVLARIRSAVPADARILVTTYWNVFEDGDVADGDYGPRFAQWSDGVTGGANDQICAAARTVGATCVDLYTPFNGAGGKDPTPLLADDGDHPNSAGHALITKALLAATPVTEQ